jgi:hypothetical protein
MDWEQLVGKVVIQVTASLPLIPTLKTLITKVLPEVLGRDSRGTKILNGVRGFSKYKRADLSAKMGDMGTARTETRYLMDFIRTIPLIDDVHELIRFFRLLIFVDDLDRCQAAMIMKIFESLFLLVGGDSPVTCWVAIDERQVVASIEKEMGGAEFKAEGLDGYQFLEKIVQIPFCIPEPNRQCKQNYMRKVFENDELDPIKICKRLAYLLDNKADIPGIEDLIKVEDAKNLLSNMKGLMKENQQILGTTAAMDILPNVMENMIKHRILKGNEHQRTMIRGPAEVLKEVKKKFEAKQDLGRQLQEEFLSFVSNGIEGFLASDRETVSTGDGGHIQETPPETPEDSPVVLLPTRPAAITNSEVDPLAWYKKQYQPMMDYEEMKWCDKYADHFSGQPRKIKRIFNSYMISRLVAEDLNLTDGVFREKLLKLIVLFEQWPYRMSWMIIIAENMQQEESLKSNIKRMKDHGINEKYSANEGLLETLEEITGVKRDLKECLECTLLYAYQILVQGLMHSPEESFMELQRDGDPQVFELLLSDFEQTDAILKLKDIALPDEENSGKEDISLRPFAFNIQSHMIEKVQNYFDDCKLRSNNDHRENSAVGVGAVYESKANFFHRKYDAPSQAPSGHLRPLESVRDDEVDSRAATV